MRRKKTLVPNDFRDFLSILSFIGFMAIFLQFAVGKSWLSENLNSLFLITAGLGIMVVSKVFTIRRWAKDGIQATETMRILGLIVGVSSLLFGFILLTSGEIGIKFMGFVGILALFPAFFIVLDYLVKNKV